MVRKLKNKNRYNVYRSNNYIPGLAGVYPGQLVHY